MPRALQNSHLFPQGWIPHWKPQIAFWQQRVLDVQQGWMFCISKRPKVEVAEFAKIAVTLANGWPASPILTKWEGSGAVKCSAWYTFFVGISPSMGWTTKTCWSLLTDKFGGFCYQGFIWNQTTVRVHWACDEEISYLLSFIFTVFIFLAFKYLSDTHEIYVDCQSNSWWQCAKGVWTWNLLFDFLGSHSFPNLLHLITTSMPTEWTHQKKRIYLSSLDDLFQTWWPILNCEITVLHLRVFWDN